MRRLVYALLPLMMFFASCDGPYFKVTLEPVVEEQCYDCCVDPEYEEPYNPDLVDPYSEDTNWYIDETGNIIWKKKR